jgi:hypothetical protein
VNGSTTTTGPSSFPPLTPNGPTPVLCSYGSTCQNASAEWVVEAPGGNTNNTLYPLGRFKPVTFNNAHASDNAGNAGPISNPAWQDNAADLINGTTDKVMARVKPLKDQGRQFRDQRAV